MFLSPYPNPSFTVTHTYPKLWLLCKKNLCVCFISFPRPTVSLNNSLLFITHSLAKELANKKLPIKKKDFFILGRNASIPLVFFLSYFFTLVIICPNFIISILFCPFVNLDIVFQNFLLYSKTYIS